MVGSAIAVSLLTYGAVPLWAGVLITAVASFLLLLLERLGVRHLEALFAVLIGVMAVAFGVMYVLAGVPTADVIEGAASHIVSPPAVMIASCLPQQITVLVLEGLSGCDLILCNQLHSKCHLFVRPIVHACHCLLLSTRQI